MDENKQAQPAPSMDTGKLIAIIGYLVPFLFFLPMVMEELKGNEFAKFHANQQLNLFLFYVVGNVAGTILSVILIGLLLIPLVNVAGLVFMVLGIINVSKGELKPLPLIGGFKLIK